MYYLCHRKEESALDTRVLSSFYVQILTYKAYFTSDIEKNRSEIFLFLGVSVIFLGQIVAPVADIERWKVKRYLFSRGADLTFQGSTQVVLDCEATCGPSVCGIYFNTNLTNLSNCAGLTSNKETIRFVFL